MILPFTVTGSYRFIIALFFAGILLWFQAWYLRSPREWMIRRAITSWRLKSGCRCGWMRWFWRWCNRLWNLPHLFARFGHQYCYTPMSLYNDGNKCNHPAQNNLAEWAHKSTHLRLQLKRGKCTGRFLTNKQKYKKKRNWNMWCVE